MQPNDKVLLNAFGEASPGKEPFSAGKYQLMPSYYVQETPPPHENQDQQQQHVHFREVQNSGGELDTALREEVASIRTNILRERRQYHTFTFIACFSVLTVTSLSVIWLHYLMSLGSYEEKTQYYKCQGIEQFISHLQTVSILTLIYCLLFAVAVLMRKRGLIFIVVGVMFITFCYRVVVSIVWVIAGSHTISTCISSDLDASQVEGRELFGFYLTLILILYDFVIKLCSFYFAGKLKSIREQQQLVMQPSKLTSRIVRRSQGKMQLI